MREDNDYLITGGAFMAYYFSHIGMKRRSGRYPWGSGNRPFQSLSVGSKKKGSSSQKALTPEEEKARVLREGTASELSKYRNELTYQELKTALDRIDLNKRLDDSVLRESQAGWRSIDRFMSNVNTVNKWADTGLKTYKNVDILMKILDGMDPQELLGGKGKKKK